MSHDTGAISVTHNLLAHPESPEPMFGDLGVPESLVAALTQQGITSPFPIQCAAIPDAISGRDVLGRAQTGSGKTLAFGLPILTRIGSLARATSKLPSAIVLVPTRELAMQVTDALRPLARAIGRRVQLITGGMSMSQQIGALENGVDIIVATPGRLLDLAGRHAVSLSNVAVSVLDEADHMADLGFIDDVSQILDLTPQHSQRLLFSATLDKRVRTVIDSYLSEPVEIAVNTNDSAPSTMRHLIVEVDPKVKADFTAWATAGRTRVMVFVRTKLGADRVAEQLRDQGVLASALHGGKSQDVRSRILASFRDGELPVLVATDVAARGIHVDDVELVLQVDPAAGAKDYLHRSGRTARAGEGGVVITLALPHQRRSAFAQLREAGVKSSKVRIGQSSLTPHSISDEVPLTQPNGKPVAELSFTRPRNGGRRPRSRGAARSYTGRPRQRDGAEHPRQRDRTERPQQRNRADRAWQHEGTGGPDQRENTDHRRQHGGADRPQQHKSTARSQRYEGPGPFRQRDSAERPQQRDRAGRPQQYEGTGRPRRGEGATQRNGTGFSTQRDTTRRGERYTQRSDGGTWDRTPRDTRDHTPRQNTRPRPHLDGPDRSQRRDRDDRDYSRQRGSTSRPAQRRNDTARGDRRSDTRYTDSADRRQERPSGTVEHRPRSVRASAASAKKTSTTSGIRTSQASGKKSRVGKKARWTGAQRRARARKGR